MKIITKIMIKNNDALRIISNNNNDNNINNNDNNNDNNNKYINKIIYNNNDI